MTRKARSAFETEKDLFPTRLRELMDERDTTQAKLAAAIGKRPQTVSLYTTGQSTPDVNCLREIAQYFNVSADWLIGRPGAVKALNVNVAAATLTTGLSEETVNYLCNLRAWGMEKELTSVIDALIYDFRTETKGEGIAPLVYLISWFLQYRGGNSGSMRVLPDGTVKECGDVTGYTSNTLKLNDRIIESAALTEIEQGLISLKKRILRKERGKNGKH